MVLLIHTVYMAAVNIRKIFGENLKYYRKKAGLSQEQLAEKLGVSPNHLSVIETGGKFVTYKLLERIISLFDIMPSALFFTPGTASFDDTLQNKINTIIKEEIENSDNPGCFKSNVYYLTYLYEDYSFNMNDLTKEERIKYLYVIVYLMLRNNQYISQKILKERIAIEISESSFKRFLDSFKMLVGFDIYKNELQSYVIEYD